MSAPIASAGPDGRQEGLLARLGALFRTTAFKLSLAYLLVFAAFAFFALGYVAWNARRVLDDQIVSTIEAEINGLSDQYASGGIRRLVSVVERRSREPGASLYLVTTPAASTSPATSRRCRPAPSPSRARPRPLTPATPTTTASTTGRSSASSPCRGAFACSSAATSRSATGCGR